MNEHSYEYLDYFDINEKVFRWDGPTTMNIESPLINSFIANVYPCLLFARKYYFKNKKDYEKNITNDKYVYCGRIKYIEHHDTNPPHFISSVEEIINEPNEKLSQLYKFKPQGLDEKLKEFGHLEEKESNDFVELTKREESRTHERKATFAGPTHKQDISMTENPDGEGEAGEGIDEDGEDDDDDMEGVPEILDDDMEEEGSDEEMVMDDDEEMSKDSGEEEKDESGSDEEEEDESHGDDDDDKKKDSGKKKKKFDPKMKKKLEKAKKLMQKHSSTGSIFASADDFEEYLDM